MVYVINLDSYKSKGIHCICLHVNGNNAPTLTAFELKIFRKKLKNLSTTKLIKQIIIEYKLMIQ